MKYFAIPLAIVVLAACSGKKDEPAKVISSHLPIPVKVIDLKSEALKPMVQTSGVFTTDDETALSFKTGGVLRRLYVKEGDKVRKGQLLASLDLTEIEAQVMQAHFGLEKASRDLVRVENLYKDSVATLEQFQNARTARDVAQKQYESATFNRGYSEIRSPGDGFVLRKLANEGQVMSPGSSVLIANSASQSAWKLKVGVSDREWTMINPGDVATVTTDALPGEFFSARVTAKASGTDAASGTFMVELTLADRKAHVASGLFGKATIQTTQPQRAWRIPFQSLLDGDGQTGYVFTTADGKVARRTPVIVMGIDQRYVLIASGLEKAGQLIVSGSAYLRDASPISVIR